MDLGGYGINAGSGFLGMFLGYLSGTKRMDRIEKEMDDKVSKDTCEICAKANAQRQSEVIAAIRRLEEKL